MAELRSGIAWCDRTVKELQAALSSSTQERDRLSGQITAESTTAGQAATDMADKHQTELTALQEQLGQRVRPQRSKAWGSIGSQSQGRKETQ